jgi:ABC-2 type transport system ATP-binding protein
MIHTSHIAYRYPKHPVFALRDVTFTVHPGEIFTLLGPNGAGKTTLIRIVSGLILPQKGTVTICGHDLLSSELAARKCLGLVLGDERTFYFRLSGAQNLEFFGGLYGLPRSQLKRRVAEALELVGLQNDAKLQFMRYSSGMRKRLNLARTLLHDPPVLLLDEPTSSVDPESAHHIRSIIEDLRSQKRTIFLTTHNLYEAERVSDRVGFLKEGRLERVGTVAEFKALTEKKRLIICFVEGSLPTSVEAQALENQIRQSTTISGVRWSNNGLTISYNGGFDMNAVLSLVSRSGRRIASTHTEEASLEDVFMTLTRQV